MDQTKASFISIVRVLVFVAITIFIIIGGVVLFAAIQPQETGQQQTKPVEITLEQGVLRLKNGEGEVDLASLIAQAVQQSDSQQPQTNVQTATTTVVQQTSRDGQTLSIAGNVLSIANGNSVALPAEQDSVVGNEVTGALNNSGLVRLGSGSVVDPYKLSLVPCASGELLKSSGVTWACANDDGGTSYSAGDGLVLTGSQFAIDSPTCIGANKLQWNGSNFACTTEQGVLSMGSLDGQSKNTTGASITSNTLYLQSADATFPGIVSATTQTFAGDKTFTGLTTMANSAVTTGNFAVRDASAPTKQYRFRTSGGSLDLEAGGASLVLSVWSGANFTGTQHNQMVFFPDGSEIQVKRGMVVNADQDNHDFQVKGEFEDYDLYVDASTDRVGIGTNTPTAKLHVSSAAEANLLSITDATGGGMDVFKVQDEGAVTIQTRTNTTQALQILSASGQPVFVLDTLNNAAKIGGGDVGANATPGLLVLDHKTTAGDPTGTNGGSYYNASSNKFRCYENSAWKNCLGMNASLTFHGTNGNGTASQWTNMPAAETEFFGSNVGSRQRFDLSDATQVRLNSNVVVAGANGAALRVQYSTDQSTWAYLDGAGPEIDIDTTGFQESAWTAVATGAKGDVYLRVVGVNGDGSASPQFGLTQLQIR